MNINIKVYVITLLLLCVLCIGCTPKPESDAVITQNNTYTVFPNRVVQGSYEAIAKSNTEIITNYKSPSDKEFSPIVEFRFSLNSRDNELITSQSHFAVVGDTKDKVFIIGEPESKPKTELPALGKNTKWKVKLDMNPVLNSFKTKGYYATPTNDTIFKEDFKGVWIAGNSAPLTWDFENLYGKDDRKLQPVGNTGIYEVEIILNPTTEIPLDPQAWKIDSINSNFPYYNSQEVLVDALYNMAIDNITSNIRPDDTFRAGAGWDGVWTRDVSYSIYLALGYLDPQRSMNSLKAKVKNNRIIQDTGTGGSWPVSSDRIVWSIAAWEIYKVTGDKEWLSFAFNVIKNSIEDDRAIVYNRHLGLMHGEQSYLDWREQSYPRWMQPKDIYESMTLGTNVLFARAYDILDKMGDELGINTEYEKLADAMSEAINKHLWIASEGYYSEYLYGGVYPIQSKAIDNLGQALSVIWDIADDTKAESIISKTPITLFGTTAIFPQIKDIKPYHNDAVWPFVQSFWNLAAAKAGNEIAVRKGIGAIYRAAALFGTHKELYVASSGDFRGTAVNSDKMLWSATGNVAMIFRMYAGIKFETDGIKFDPFVPVCIKGEKSIKNFKYRNSILSITINGTGNDISSMTIDGIESKEHFFPATMTGNHEIVINMTGKPTKSQKVNMSSVDIMPSTPSITWDSNVAKINNYSNKVAYDVFLNGKKSTQINVSKYAIQEQNNYTVVYMIPQEGKYTGFMGTPHEYIPQGALTIVECEKFALAGTSLIKGEMSNKFIETTITKNTNIAIPITVDASGTYFIDVRYANGNGPINTENKCAIRTLLVNNNIEGAIVMPQRGLGEWLSSGFSNMLQVELKKGANTLNIKYITPQNVNMNNDNNTALIDYIRIIRK